MKHLLSVLLISLVALSAKAQIFAGANAGVAYSNEVFSMAAEPYIGYEFNDKVAAGTGVGIEVFDGEAAAIFNPFIRFTPWQNEMIALNVGP